MKGCVNKRGLSPVVASALLILLVLVLAAIVFFWARGFIGEQVEKFGEPIEESCGNVRFEVAINGDEMEVLNKGDISIKYLEVRMNKAGESRIKRFDFSVDPREFKNQTFSFSMSDVEAIEPDEIVVYPALIGKVVGEASNSMYTCIDSGVTL